MTGRRMRFVQWVASTVEGAECASRYRRDGYGTEVRLAPNTHRPEQFQVWITPKPVRPARNRRKAW